MALPIGTEDRRPAPAAPNHTPALPMVLAMEWPKRPWGAAGDVDFDFSFDG